MSHNQLVGRAGENAAAEFYENLGFEILARNWRAPLAGGANEIDIVAANRATLAFCEVKTRSGTLYGSGADAVGIAKQRRIRRAARVWLAQNSLWIPEVRFDVAVVDRQGRVDLLEACF